MMSAESVMEAKSVDKQLLERLLREAEAAHGRYETELGRHDDNWPAWYARYIVERLPAIPSEDYIREPEELPSAEPYLNE